MDVSKIGKTCIKYNWYKCWNNAEYVSMLNKCADYKGETSERQTNLLLEIATDIYEHSDPENRYHGADKDDCIRSIMCALANECMVICYMDYDFFHKFKESLSTERN